MNMHACMACPCYYDYWLAAFCCIYQWRCAARGAIFVALLAADLLRRTRTAALASYAYCYIGHGARCAYVRMCVAALRRCSLQLNPPI